MLISDTHNDFLTKLNKTECLSYLKSCENQNVKNLLASVFTSEMKQYNTIQNIEKCNQALLEYGNKSYKIHVEDLGFVKTIKALGKLIELKPFSCSLTWNNDNRFAGGNFGIKGISKEGKKLISLLDEAEIIIDVAHLNKKSFRNFQALNTRPIFCSHTGLEIIKKSPRNLANSQVRAIIDSNGYFGLFLSSTFMTKSNVLDSESFARAIYKTMCKFGDKNFGLGSDFYGIGQNPRDINSYLDLLKVKNTLIKMGIGQDSIDRFFFQNFEDFKLQSSHM